MNKSRLLCFLAISVLLVSCKSTRLATNGKVKKIPAEELMGNIEQNNIQYSWVSAKAKVKYDDGKKARQFTVHVKMRHDSIIWVNITGAMGLEAARMKMGTDTVRLLDRLGKIYCIKPVSYLQQYIPFEFDINQLQEILVGNYLWKTDGKQRSKVEDGRHILTIDGKEYSSLYKVRAEDYAIEQFTMLDKIYNRKVFVDIEDYKQYDETLFSQKRKIRFEAPEGDVAIEIRFTRVKWNDKQSFPFYVNDKYEPCK